jgi:prepilin-type N-terminal cleavage/methylation domain-containing protein
MKRSLQNGFTLVELLVVIAIIGILVALLLPAVQAAREAARRTDCANRIRQVSLAAHNHLSARGTFPSSAEDPYGVGGSFSQYSYLATMLPYYEDASLHDLIDFKQPWNSAANAEALATPMPQLKCPSQDERQFLFDGPYQESNLGAHYFAVLGGKTRCPWNKQDQYSLIGSSGVCVERGGIATNGIMYPLSKTRPKEITDGLSKTFLIGEISWDHHGGRTWYVGTSQTGSWSYSGYNLAYPMYTSYRFTFENGQNGTFATAYPNNDMSFGSSHNNGAHFAFGDASVKYVDENVSILVYREHASRAGNEASEEL